jgi:Predicted drug exporters of the RND superfamily
VARHARLTLLLWVLVLPVAVLGAGRFNAALATGDVTIEGSPSHQAAQLVAERFADLPPETDVAVLHSDRLDYDDTPFRTLVQTALHRFRAIDQVAAVTDPGQAPDRLVSADRRTVLIPIAIRGDAAARQALAGELAQVAADLATADISVEVTGTSPLAAASIERANEDLARSDAVALPVAAVILLVAFGSLVAAALPLALGGVAVVAAFGLLGALSSVISFNAFTRTAVTMLSIALGIDYALFMITRFREELLADSAPASYAELARQRAGRVAAVGRTVATAGHAVAFSGVAVMVCLAGLLLVDSARVRGMAIGMIAAVAVMVALALTVVPALLALLGPRVNALALPWARRRLRNPDPERSIWARIADVSLRRPILVAGLSLVALLALTVPVIGLRYGVADQVGPVADTAAGRGFARMTEQFPSGTTAPVEIVVARDHGPLDAADLEAIARVSRAAAADPAVAGVTSITSVLDERAGGHTPEVVAAAHREGWLDDAGSLISPGLDAAIISVTPRHGPYAEQTADLVHRLRAAVPEIGAAVGRTVLVGGAPAQLVDIAEQNATATPVVIAAVLGAAALILLLAFRSVLLPATAVLMNVCTVGAACGAMVLIFQNGYGADLLGLNHDGFVQVFIPLTAFTLVFGLSMDYEVFLVSRMQEAWQATGDNRAAVRAGITHTARVITAAAAIMVAVFGAFMLTDISDVQQLGFMLAFAILIDATVVRLFLMPALMRLFGRWNWWLPGWTSPPKRP